MKKLLGFLFTVGGVLLGLYVGGWLLFVKPIIDVCYAIDNHTISAIVIGIAVIKCIFASLVGVLIGYLGIVIGIILNGGSDHKKRCIRKRR